MDMRRTDLPAALTHIIIMLIILYQSLDLNDSRSGQEELRAAAVEGFNPVYPQLCWEEHLQSYILFTVSMKTQPKIITLQICANVTLMKEIMQQQQIIKLYCWY